MILQNALSFVLILGLLPAGSALAKCSDRRAPGIDWSGCKKTSKMMGESNFSGGRFDDANLALSQVDDSNFTGASLVKTDLTRSSAVRSKFIDADLTKAVGYRANFDHAVLRNTKLTKSEFSRAHFKSAVITDVDWSKSELGRVDFSGARLRNVDFSFSNLSRVVFGNSRLDNVSIAGAYTYLTHFEDTDLTGFRDLTQEQIDLACGNGRTRLPSDRRMPDSWPCEE